MTKVQLPQVGAVWDALPAPRPIPQGGEFHRPRGFVAPPAAPAEAASQDETPDVEAAEPCTDLGGACVKHRNYGALVHYGPLHTVAVAGEEELLAHQLIHWGDDTPRLSFVGQGRWPDLELHEVDALIAAVEQQLAHLRDSRAHLAAALGVAPPTEPPENQQARPADGTDGQVTQ